jgi:hypothetical protein
VRWVVRLTLAYVNRSLPQAERPPDPPDTTAADAEAAILGSLVTSTAQYEAALPLAKHGAHVLRRIDIQAALARQALTEVFTEERRLGKTFPLKRVAAFEDARVTVAPATRETIISFDSNGDARAAALVQLVLGRSPGSLRALEPAVETLLAGFHGPRHMDLVSRFIDTKYRGHSVSDAELLRFFCEMVLGAVPELAERVVGVWSEAQLEEVVRRPVGVSEKKRGGR